MLARALIVLLVVVNLGVATWWLTRSERPQAQIPSQVEGVPLLRLQAEPTADRGRNAAQTAATPTMHAAADPLAPVAVEPANQEAVGQEKATAPTASCYSIGPYDERSTRDAALERLRPRTSLAQARSEQVADGTGTPGWRVWMPPAANREAAQATAKRISDAGFQDYFIVSKGDDANGIALGRYSSEATAKAREATLRAAGFTEARAEPLGGTSERYWADVAVSPNFDPDVERKALSIDKVESIDCARLQ